MFGLRLKTWMEAHLKPRHKSTASQNQKQHRSAPKDSSSSSAGTITITTTTTTNSSTSGVVSISGVSSTSCTNTTTNSSSNTTSLFHPVERHNSDQNPCTGDLSLKTTATSSTLANSSPRVLETPHHEKETEQLHHPRSQQDGPHLSQSRPTQQSVSTSSNSTNILLGSFSNNLSLSSPDTGYSTDGYSPKSVYPALSFESSGKSTPKSCYTISSLVSSERLHHLNNSSCSGGSSKSAGGAPSKNSSISNGLELEEEECDLHIPNGDETSIQSSTAHSSLNLPEEGEEEEEQHSHNSRLRVKENDRLDGSVNIMNSSNCPTGSVRPPPSMDSKMKEHGSNAIPTRFPCSETTQHDFFHHRRTESMDEQRARHEGIENSSKLIGGGGGGGGGGGVCGVGPGRNIRTSLLLTSSSQIPPECNPGLKNAFSICSPRRQRTRIKTNPWITLTQHNDSMFHVDYLHNRGGGGGGGGVSGPQTNKQIPCPVSSQQQQQQNYTGGHVVSTMKMEEINKVGAGTESGTERGQEMEDGGTDSGVQSNSVESTSQLYRISMSTTTSDSGKGSSMEPGTNRNSTESSSCLLSDSTNSSNSENSARNSIISPENTISSSSSIIIPPTKINTPVQNRMLDLQQQQQQQCVTSQPSKTNIGSTSSSSSSTSKQLKSKSSSNTANTNTPSICITSSSKPSGKRLNPMAPPKRLSTHNNKLSGPLLPSLTSYCAIQGPTVQGPRCSDPNKSEINYHSMVDKETDILSDWANTEDEDGDEEGENEDENDDDDQEEEEEDCITPTPSSPDVTFNNSSSCSSKLEFIDVADRVRHPKTNINLHVNNSGVGLGGPPLLEHHGRLVSFPQHNMNLPTTCYQSVPISPNILGKHSSSPRMRHIPDAYAYDNVHHLNQLDNQIVTTSHLGPIITTTPPSSATTTTANSGTRCFDNGIQNSKLKSSSYTQNSATHTSQTIARGAIGFLRKMFKKGSTSSSSHLNGRENKGDKFLRSHGAKKDNNSCVDRDSDTIIPVGLFSPESVVVSNYPLSNTKPLSPAINGNFILTPTPNSFRRRSTGPGGNSDLIHESTTTNKSTTNTSKHKVIKTDIIRLPPPPSTSSQSSSAGQGRSHHLQSNGIVNGAPYNNSPNIPGYHPSPHQQHLHHQSNVSNTNTSSTTGSSSIHSMSITSQGSTNSRSDLLQQQQHEQLQRRMTASPALNPSHHENYIINDGIHHSRQSPYMSTPTNHHHSQHHHPNNRTPRPQHHNNNNNFNNGNYVSASPRFCPTTPQSQCRDFDNPTNLNSKACPYDSPRLQGSRINSPSFNNYSPIHRIVVTGGHHHLLNRGVPLPPPGSSTSSFHPPPPTVNSHHHHSPLLVHHPLTPNSHGHNLNRPVVTTTSSPLISHRHSGLVTSSTQQQHPFFVNCSPSPVLRNPRYQYITSSNQNSPLLNIPKRLNVPLNPKGVLPPPSQLSKHNIPLFQSPSSPSTFLNHGSTNGGQQHNNSYCQNSVRAQDPSPQSHSRHQMSRVTSSAHPHTQQLNTDNNNPMGGGGGPPVNGIFSPPDLFRQNNSHYYSSPVAGTRDSMANSPFYHHRGPERIYETVDDSEEEDEDDFRSDDGDGEGGDFEFQIPEQCLATPEYRIPRRMEESDVHFRRSIDSDTSIVIGASSSSHSHNLQLSVSSSGSSGSRCKSKSTAKSKSTRSKRDTIFSPPSSSSQKPPPPQKQQPPLPPRSFPMSLGTYLSETEERLLGSNLSETERRLLVCPTEMETRNKRLLDEDRDTDRKYKRLIDDAEALLKQISIEKSQPTSWLSRHARESLLRHEDCPQSDPLRRKAYDCWALRRLQNQLAGIASPPVLHRKSPMSPSGNQNFGFVFRDHREFPFPGDRRVSLSSGNNPLL